MPTAEIADIAGTDLPQWDLTSVYPSLRSSEFHEI